MRHRLIIAASAAAVAVLLAAVLALVPVLGGHGSPSYQSRSCNSNAQNCTPLAGRDASGYTLANSDSVNRVFVRVTVKKNLTGESTTADSAATGVISGGDRTLDCFPQPGACGYPDPNYSSDAASAWASGGWGVGPYCDSQLQSLIGCTPNAPVACSSLPNTSAGGTVSGTVSDTDYAGAITIFSNATLHDDCVTATGNNLARSRTAAITVNGGPLTVTDSTISSTSSTQMVEWGIHDGAAASVTLQHDYVHDFGESLQGGNWNVSDSYILTSNGALTPNGTGGPTDNCASPCPESTQDVYFDPSGSTSLSFVHDTLLNPHGEAVGPGEGAVIFGDDVGRGSCGSWTLTVENNLIAGGSSGITTCGADKATSAGSTSIDIVDNDYARCDTPTVGYSPSGDTSAVSCQGATVPATRPNSGGGVYPGADSHGYAPNGGSHVVNYIEYCNGTVSGNYWDDTGGTGALSGTGTLALDTCGNVAPAGTSPPTSNPGARGGSADSPLGTGASAGAASPSYIKALLSAILIPHGKAAKIKALLSHGGYTFTWTAPFAGRLTISWHQVPKGAHVSRKPTPILVATLTRTFSRASNATLKIALTRTGKRLLKSVRRVKLTAKASFAPRGKSATSIITAFTLTA